MPDRFHVKQLPKEIGKLGCYIKYDVSKLIDCSLVWEPGPECRGWNPKDGHIGKLYYIGGEMCIDLDKKLDDPVKSRYIRKKVLSGLKGYFT